MAKWEEDEAAQRYMAALDVLIEKRHEDPYSAAHAELLKGMLQAVVTWLQAHDGDSEEMRKHHPTMMGRAFGNTLSVCFGARAHCPDCAREIFAHILNEAWRSAEILAKDKSEPQEGVASVIDVIMPPGSTVQ